MIGLLDYHLPVAQLPMIDVQKSLKSKFTKNPVYNSCYLVSGRLLILCAIAPEGRREEEPWRSMCSEFGRNHLLQVPEITKHETVHNKAEILVPSSGKNTNFITKSSSEGKIVRHSICSISPTPAMTFEM